VLDGPIFSAGYDPLGSQVFGLPDVYTDLINANLDEAQIIRDPKY
jgi:hypothetical protein